MTKKDDSSPDEEIVVAPAKPSPDEEIAVAAAERIGDNPQMVTVVAPSTLAEGYTFPAQVDGKDFTVTVPAGGVQVGQHFQVPYPTGGGSAAVSTTVAATEPQANISDAPRGRWRYSLCECCSVFCNCMFWQSCCCEPILFAQLMQRMKLDWCGGRNGKTDNTCNVVTIIYAVYLGLYLLGFGEILALPALIYFLIIYTKTRYAYRKHYEIEPSCCTCCDGAMDDCCCGCCCACCVGIQMTRHTHDENKYEYQCCSGTGLPPDAPAIIV